MGAMDLDSDFIKLANSIRQNVLGLNTQIVPNKVSQYNAKIVIDCCQICKKKTEEVHHIKAQELANDDNMIDTHHKNVTHNLIQLCHDCHQQVHNGNLEISGYIQTT